MNNHKIKTSIEPIRKRIVDHEMYAHVKTTEELRIFMQYHVFAVWDFMSLLKTLQNNLTCTSVPWFPKGDAETRYLINEIVAGEESDVDENGERKSHFELYLEAMKQCGADTSAIETFISALKKGSDLETAFTEANVPAAVRSFVSFTFRIINSGKIHVQAAVFTFGREDLIPGMFYSIVNEMHNNNPEQIRIFKYYLERHIEVDGDHHSELALKMTSNLCGDNETYLQEAEAASIESLQKRMELWDGAFASLRSA